MSNAKAPQTKRPRLSGPQICSLCGQARRGHKCSLKVSLPVKSSPQKLYTCPLHSPPLPMTTRHRVIEKWVPDLRRGHSATEKMRRKVVVGLRICCQHFAIHGHDGEPLYLLDSLLPKDVRSFPPEPSNKKLPQSTPVAPKSRISNSSPLPERRRQLIADSSPLPAVPQAPIFRDRPLRKSTERQTLDRSVPETCHPAVASLLLTLNDQRLPLSSVLTILDQSDNNPDDPSITLQQVFQLMRAAVTRANEQKKLSYWNFKYFRKDLYVWTGVSKISTIEDQFVTPLSYYFLNLSNPNKLPASSISIADRVIWLLMYLWSSDSFETLQRHLTETSSYTGTSSALANLLRRTARSLADCMAQNVSLPSLEELRKQNCNTGMEKYANELFVILDGTSLPIRTPGTDHFHKRTYVVYKAHHAYRYFVAVAASGLILFVSGVDEGSMNDTEQYSQSTLPADLEKNYPTSSMAAGEKMCLVGDKGYIYCIPPAGFDLLCTKSGEAELRFSADGQNSVPATGDPGLLGTFVRRFETEVAVPRAVVERTISLVKRWGRLNTPCFSLVQGDQLPADLVMISCSFANHLIRSRQSKIIQAAVGSL